MAEERGDRERIVVREISVHDPIAEQRLGRRAAGRRHVRHDHVARRMRDQQPLDERRGRAGLADRDRVDPDASRPRTLSITTDEALGPALPVFGLLACAPQQIDGDRRRQQDPQDRVDQPSDAFATAIAAWTGSAWQRCVHGVLRQCSGSAHPGSREARATRPSATGGAIARGATTPSRSSASITASASGWAPSVPKPPRLIERADQYGA